MLPTVFLYSIMPAPLSFFLKGSAGNLFAMYYPPFDSDGAFGDVLYVHPFAGEMPASRNVIAALSRDLARMGFGVLSIDLFGCGDSEGDFGDARWEIWTDDLSLAVGWLQERGQDRVSLWGLRLGALLAWSFARRWREQWERIFLWEPILSGEKMMTQFLHGNLDEARDGRLATRLIRFEERKLLSTGSKVEIAGYELGAELIRSIDRAGFDRLDLTLPVTALQAPVVWVEIGNTRESSLAAETRLLHEEWRKIGQRFSVQHLSAPPFWLSPYSVDPSVMTAALPRLFGEDIR